MWVATVRVLRLRLEAPCSCVAYRELTVPRSCEAGTDVINANSRAFMAATWGLWRVTSKVRRVPDQEALALEGLSTEQRAGVLSVTDKTQKKTT
jgi:hypothetical protein